MSEDFLSTLLADMEVAAKRTEKKFGDDLQICFLGEADFTMRLVLDSKQKLYHEWYMYNVPIPMKDAEGKEIEKRHRYRIPGKKADDPIAPYAEELGHFSYKSRYYCTFFGEIVTITKGQNEYFKPGPCLLVTNNRKFWTALNSAMQALAKRGEAGKKYLRDTLTPDAKGILINVRNTKGQSGACAISYELPFAEEEPTHTFLPEAIEKFQDITQVYCPELGAENDRNCQLIINHYKKLIEDKAGQAEPDIPGAAEAAANALKKPIKKEEAVEEDQYLSDLDKAMAAE
jgi:hypothetical protein